MEAPAEVEGTTPTPLAPSVPDGRQKRKQRRRTPDEAEVKMKESGVAIFGPYMKREEQFVQRESKGEMLFIYLRNDSTLHSLKLLTDVKNVYSRQLPNMPKEYICKLVFNKTHRSVAVLKEGRRVVGGITYKTFADQRFAEIAFCAVEGLEQVQGIGTRMMNYCKLYAQRLDGVRNFLTYADNNAIGYFSKQGFSKHELPQKKKAEMRQTAKSKSQEGDESPVPLPPTTGRKTECVESPETLGHGLPDQYEWAGYIKDYDGGTLMECQILPQLPYTMALRMAKRHRESLVEKMQQNSKSHIVQPGMTFPKQRKRRRLNPADILGLEEAGWTHDQLSTNLHFKLNGVWEESDPETLNRFLYSLLESVKKLPEAEPFLKPVTVEDAIDYFDIVKDPMDLSVMEKRLDSDGYYSSLEIFKADMNLMIENCRLYNRADTIYYKYANRLEQAFQKYLNENMKEF